MTPSAAAARAGSGVRLPPLMLYEQVSQESARPDRAGNVIPPNVLASVLTRHLHGIDHEHIDRLLARLELQTELFLNGGEDIQT